MCLWKITLLLILDLILQDPVACYKTHSALSSIVFTNIESPEDGKDRFNKIVLCPNNTEEVIKFHDGKYQRVFPLSDDVHSEYYFGRCADWQKTLVAHQHWTYSELKGKMIVRGWLSVQQEPTCAYVRSKSSYGDLIRYQAFKFNVCICRLVYNYGGKKYIYYYYEWFIPVQMKRELNWDVFFYVS